MQNPSRLVRTRFGFNMALNPIDRGVSAVIGGLGCWEPKATFHFRRLLQEARVVVDVGANIGWYSLLAAKSGALVYAFEPEAINFDLLMKSLELNGFENILAFPYVICDRDGETWLTITDSDNKGTHSTVIDVGKHRLRVPCWKLDSLFPKQTIDILKIDAEGAEPEVLMGAQQLIKEKRVKYILMEWTPRFWRERESILEPFQIFSIDKKSQEHNLLLIAR